MSEQAPKTPRQLGEEAEALYALHQKGKGLDEGGFRTRNGIYQHDINRQEANEHYRDNAALFHDLGVLEAAMDGKEIHTQHPFIAGKHVEAYPPPHEMTPDKGDFTY